MAPKRMCVVALTLRPPPPRSQTAVPNACAQLHQRSLFQLPPPPTPPPPLSEEAVQLVCCAFQLN